MPEIIPRWEWRTFTYQTDVEAQISMYPLTRQVESSDVYILSELSMENTKVRDNLMDIKSLQVVTKDGLEQWKPVKKAKFPLPLSEVQAMFSLFKVPMPEFSKEVCTFEEFVELARSDDRIICVTVDKSRRLYDVKGCIVEVAALKIEGRSIMTVAVELEDPDKVREIMQMLGLTGLENINYVTAIKRMHKGEL
ncbi:hypothetical protein U27_03460 [Candidatus Vecturithrix granuli]|uniref:CYTH domain-containing protein n=1 Tax=Vecturithrix granuli TaxID=1499967 RepID=A0A081BVZ3_VECG1|nr:hypothetical protein U27_03460 [Candidatus Vecturithrix granuli]